MVLLLLSTACQAIRPLPKGKPTASQPNVSARDAEPEPVPEPEPLKNHRFRFLTDLAALPPTQVSVKRLFSAMKILLTDLRSKMKDDIVEAILFLKSNQCV